MTTIENLEKEAELFAATSRLQAVSAGLKRIIDGENIGEREKENFEWAGYLLGQIDWDSEHFRKGEHSELCLIATELRLKFYKLIRELRIPFNPRFSERLYETLTSSGKTHSLNSEELNQSYQLVQSIASDILQEIQDAHGMGQI